MSFGITSQILKSERKYAMEKLFNQGLEKLLAAKKRQIVLHSFFEYQDLKRREQLAMRAAGLDPDAKENAGKLLCRCVSKMSLTIPEGSVFAGTQDDSFSPSYALINPAFTVESFAGYCDPVAIYDDVEVCGEVTAGRIDEVRNYYRESTYVKNLTAVYDKTENYTSEVAFFMEPVTGHMIPDMRPILAQGMTGFVNSKNIDTPFAAVMKEAAEAAAILASRYADLAEKLCVTRRHIPGEVERLQLIVANCRQVPMLPAQNLHQAMQSYLLCWQLMCLEQAPNPYAFSAGNIDRVFEPYRKDTGFESAVALMRHFLAFYMVGNRGWAISQNILLGGKDADGNDLTCGMTEVILEAFFRSNCPQPALSIKIHSGTPEKLYRNMGRFYFTPGELTPSLFNDDMMFKLLEKKGIAKADIPDWSVAGCQEPLIMGKENGNTTNSWLNLAKVLELTLNDGCSLLSGKKIALSTAELGYASQDELYADLKTAFLKQLDHVLAVMEKAANSCTEVIGSWATPFGSLLFGGLDSGRDMRDPQAPGVKYCGSGCLIHGLSVVTDSLTAVKYFLAENNGNAAELLAALQDNFASNPQLRAKLQSYPKYGSRLEETDSLAAELTAIVSAKVYALRNPAGKPFMPDYSTPSTHLLYGFWVGATPDGRPARAMLGYGIDPRPEAANGELTDQLISERNLPFETMPGGYASHIGLAPSLFDDGNSMEDKGILMRDRIISPLFAPKADGTAPFYVYFNIDSAARLRKILTDPAKYVPSGIYIMRIHGTFVNFLDLAPAIQEDIIKRLERRETA